MLIKLHEIIQDNKPKTAGIFILTANYDNNKIFIKIRLYTIKHLYIRMCKASVYW